MYTTLSKLNTINDQTTYQPSFFDPSVEKNDSGQFSRGLHRSSTTKNGGTTSTLLMVSIQVTSTSTDSSTSPKESRQRARRQTRQGAADRNIVERGPKREHLLTTAWASGDLLSPNWLSDQYILEPLFGPIAFLIRKSPKKSTHFTRAKVTLIIGCIRIRIVYW